MTYLTYGFCGLTVLWLAYLLYRSKKLCLPERLGVCRHVSVGESLICCLFVAALLGITIWTTTQDEPGVWALQLSLMALIAVIAAALSANVYSSMAFDAEGFVICGLFSAPKRYAWADVTDCRTVKTVVPRSNKPCNMYCLKLPGREIALHDYRADECAFIRELRRHKPMMNIPVPGRKGKA